MARFVFTLLAVFTLMMASITYAAPKEHLVGSVFFVESGKQDYLRMLDNAEEDIFSAEDAATAVAVLLGVPPSLMLSAASSAKLDSLLSSNPFKRPRAVVCLVMTGASIESLTSEEVEEIFELFSFQRRPLAWNSRPTIYEIPSQDVVLQSLNHKECKQCDFLQVSSVQLEQGLEALVSFLEGTYHKTEDTGVNVLKIALPLDDVISISLDLKKVADWKFAVELLELFHCAQSVPNLEKESEQGLRNHGKLFMGNFSALEMMEDTHRRRSATKLFMFTAMRMFGALEGRFQGQIVGVFAFSTSTTQMTLLPKLGTGESRSPRFLQDDELISSPGRITNTSLIKEGERLIWRSHVLVTSLILLLATGLGSFFLLFMPVTRDTLLYSGIKLD